jgi:hypothetical protein
MATAKKSTGRPTKDAGTKGLVQSIRVEQAELDRLDAVAGRLVGLGTRAGVARAALLIGLDAIEKDPSVLLGIKTKH